MKFTKDSALTKIWVSLVLSGVYTVEQVPHLFGLYEAAKEVIDSLQEPQV